MKRIGYMYPAAVLVCLGLTSPLSASTITAGQFAVRSAYCAAGCGAQWHEGLRAIAQTEDPRYGTVAASPGVLAVDPGNIDLDGNGSLDMTNELWRNYVPAARDGVDYVLRNIVMKKEMGVTNECAVSPDYLKKVVISPQQGAPNIRTWWPLMYSNPGTTWTLTIDYTTPQNYDPDGPGGPAQLDTRHRIVWKWVLDDDLASVRNLIKVFHQLPFGLCEVPLISNEALYGKLLELWGAVEMNLNSYEPNKKAAIDTLFEFDRQVQLACVSSCVRTRPLPGGPGTGIANTWENPACCKLLATIEWIERKYGLSLGSGGESNPPAPPN